MAVLQGYRDVSRDIRNRYERKPLFTMDVTKNIIDESKGVVPAQQEPIVPIQQEQVVPIQQGQVVPPRNPVLPPEDRDNAVDTTTDLASREVTTSNDIRSVLDKTSVSKNPTVQKAFEETLSATIGPLASLYTAPRAFLGTVAATMESFEDGVLGDAFGTREREDARDRVEDRGYSRAQTAAGVAADTNLGGYTGIDPGVGPSGYGLDPGLSDMDPYGGYDLDSGDIGSYGVSDDVGVDSNLDGFGDIGNIGPSSFGGFEGSLGDAAAGDNDGPSEGGGTGRGSSDNDSSAGGIGGV